MSQFNTTSYQVPRTTGVCAVTGRTLKPGEKYYAALVEEPSHEHEEAKTQTPAVPEAPSSRARGASAAGLGLARLDVSAEAWERGERPGGLFSFWKSTLPQPNEKKKLFVDDAVLMNLLRRLGDAHRPERLAFRYVLALILMRKKLLRYDASVTRRPPLPMPPPTTATASPAAPCGEEKKQSPRQDQQTAPPPSPHRVFWQLTPKVDPAKGPLGKWDEQQTIEVLDPRLDESQIEQVTVQLGEILEAEL